MSSLTQARNGRLCFQTLHDHFLGRSNSQNLGLPIMEVLRNLTYDGKSKNFTFNKFTAKHSDYHMSADNLAGFNSLTQETRCQLFVSGICNPAFEACKVHVIAQGTMMSNFSAVKTYFTNYARQCAFQNPTPPSCNLSAVLGRGGRSSGRGAGHGQDRGCGAGRRDKGGYCGIPSTDEKLAAFNVAIKDYSEEEYSQLMSIQRYKLWLLQKSSDGHAPLECVDPL